MSVSAAMVSDVYLRLNGATRTKISLQMHYVESVANVKDDLKSTTWLLYIQSVEGLTYNKSTGGASSSAIAVANRDEVLNKDMSLA